MTVPVKKDQFGIFFKIKLLLPQGRVGFELQNALLKAKCSGVIAISFPSFLSTSIG